MKPEIMPRFRYSAAIALVLAAGSLTAQAQLYWDGNDLTANADGGSGTWDTTTANWDDAATAGNPATWNNASNSTAIFGGTAGTVTLGTHITAMNLTFNTTGYTVSGVSGTSDLTFAGSTRRIDTAAGVSAEISARIVGGSGNSFIKIGTGTLTLSGNNSTFTGEVSIGASGGTNAGITIAAHNSAFGTGQLTLNQASSGGNTVLRSNGSTRTLGNAVSQAGNFTLGGAGTGDLIFTNTLALGSGGKTLTVDSITVDFQGNITRNSTGNLYAKSGSGTLIISGNASGFGGTSAGNAATLAVSEGTAMINGTLGNTTHNTGRVSVSSGATLGGTGTITGTLTASGTVAPGSNGIGTLTAGATTFNNNSIFSWDVSASGASYDKFIAPSVAGQASPAGDAIFRVVVADTDFSNSFWSTSQTWTDIFTTNGTTAIANWADLFVVSVVDGNFNPLTLPGSASFTISGNTLTWTPIPEPTSALAGLLLTTGLWRRRRQSDDGQGCGRA